MAEPYFELIAARSQAAAGRWLGEALQRMQDGAVERGPLLAAYAGAPRRLGAAPVVLAEAEQRALRAACLPAPEGWPLDQLGRAVLLRGALAALPSAAHEAWVRELYQRGDNREREALLRGLILLPEPGRFLGTAVEACRSSVQSVFEAIACENDYAPQYFPEPSFNQLVLKALFTEVALARVRGLAARVTPELVRMARDYAAERRAAGREVPRDLHLLAAAAEVR